MFEPKLTKNFLHFVAVVEEGSFTRAAKKLGITQPPLTAHVQALEQALETTLLIRSRHGVRLSPDGARFFPAIMRFVTEVQRFEREFEAFRKMRREVLGVGATDLVMLGPLPLLIAQFREAYPHVFVDLVEMRPAEMISRLNARDVDFVIGPLDESPPSNVSVTPISHDYLMLAVPATHGLAGAVRVSLRDLQHEHFAMVARGISPLRHEQLLQVLRTHDLSPIIVQELPTTLAVLAQVNCSNVVALVPTIRRELAPPNVRLIELAERIPMTSLSMACRAHDDRPLVRAFLESVSANVANRTAIDAVGT